ncbi:class I SAM-dependent methyltransferase [Anoxynatronum buryatiense]|uniref:Cyclopropane fatty-acyl-phospholipid synthase n=1 Tax=Anoxynatronum buryatiense TaxID=489973 RepID=A0AA45WYP1_9CLOT|nr:class I SAM-dependent methyltransferase [Anoxynatronum buryatiense]SMP69294.1 Cyclopropane fatty-acyl-phospholipid synthase [Anoxynatronum buryatiense]
MQMKTVEESVVTALDGGNNLEIFPYLPYILQDLWEIGTDPKTVISIIGRHFQLPEQVTMLDLGCGKGAVSVKVAHRHGSSCHGIDAVPAFIQYAVEKAVEFGVEKLCRFEVGDIRKAVKDMPAADVILLGAIGPVLGNYESTLSLLQLHLKENGLIIIDDAYIAEDSEFRHPLILPYLEMKRQIENAGFQIVENFSLTEEEVAESEVPLFEPLKKRCLELAAQYPEKQSLFLDYIKQQETEGDVNAHHAVCTTLVLKRRHE